MNLDLSNKRALVCGGSLGIGKAVAKELSTLGCQVTLLSRNEDHLSSAVKDLEGSGHSYLMADHANSDDLKRIISDHIAKDNSYHILINNSGGPSAGPALDATEDQFIRAIRMHVVGNQIISQALIPAMKKENYGRIINIISTSVKQPIPGLMVSNTTRAAVANWAKTLSQEVGAYGITVNNVLPGSTDTVRIHELAEDRASRSGNSKDDELKKIISAGSIKRLAEPWEIGAAVAFLASPSASYITGINLPVDGGKTQSL
ncbi:MAG: SDR family oxidoreductase [Flavobacteriales bacterium]|nr:SDR family oxidoreductase [Flavobacteriales bacterium]